EELPPVGRIGKTRVVEKSLGLHEQALPIDHRRPLGAHLDPDACQRAALRELQRAQVLLDEIELRRVAGPEREGEADAAVAVLRAPDQDLTVLAGPDLLPMHRGSRPPRRSSVRVELGVGARSCATRCPSCLAPTATMASRHGPTLAA